MVRDTREVYHHPLPVAMQPVYPPAMRRTPTLLLFVLLACRADPLGPVPLASPGDSMHAEAIARFRATREAFLRSSASPFTLVAVCRVPVATLPAPVGSADDAACRLAPASATNRLGTLSVHADSLRLKGDSLVWVGAKAAREAELLAQQDHPDVEGAAAWRGPLRVSARWSGATATIAITDTLDPRRAAFTGVATWPTDRRWWFPAQFTPSEPAWRERATVRNFTAPWEKIGTLRVVVDATTYDLTVFRAGRRSPTMLVVFGDETNGRGSYPAGRFLDVPRPDSLGRTVVDFNLARNPDCAFSPASPCPLPPPGNRLPLAIPAGERALVP